MKLEEVRALITIDKHRLDEHLATNAAVMEQIGRQVAWAENDVRHIKKRLESIEAKVIAELRTDDEKMSNAVAEKEARRDARWTEQWEKYSDAQHHHAEWVAAEAAWKQRGWDLRAMTDLYGHQYFELTTTTSPDSVRRAMRDAVERAPLKETRRRTLVNS